MSKPNTHVYVDFGRLSRVRRGFLWASVATCLLLAAVSIVTSFLGADRTRAAFNSIPGVALWAVMAMLLAAGPVIFPTLRRPGLLAAHLGGVLILIGAAWGSTTAHRLRGALTGRVKPAAGVMVVHAGRTANAVWDRSGTRRLAELNFNVYLEKFWIEYHATAPDEPWVFSVEALAPGQTGPAQRWRRAQAPWQVGQETELPFCDVSMDVLDYHLVQFGRGDDAPILPSAKIVLRRGRRRREELIEPLPGVPYVRVPLARLYDSARAWNQAGAPVLFLEPPSPMVKDYKSALVIRREGREVARKTIEVNAPLHYGGYHFYQYDYDHAAGEYTVLAAASDSGLYLVYAGFILLAGGMIWHALPLKRLWRRWGRAAEG